jgi:hypothetical protein
MHDLLARKSTEGISGIGHIPGTFVCMCVCACAHVYVWVVNVL